MITRARKAREIRLTYTTSFLEILIKCASSIGARKAREGRIINDIPLLKTSTEYASSIGNVDYNLPISDESNVKFLVNNQLHRLQRTLS